MEILGGLLETLVGGAIGGAVYALYIMMENNRNKRKNQKR